MINSLVKNKLALALGLVATAFIISTIVLAVLKAQDDIELQECLDGLSTTLEPVVTTQAPAATTERPEEPAISYRLPTNVIPTVYTLHLDPNLQTQLFNGTNRITLNVLSRTNEIVVHSNGLHIVSTEFKTNDRTISSSFELDSVREFLRIKLSEFVEPGTGYVLTITFGGDMTVGIVGLYSSSYTSPSGELRYMATSKFEPTYARQAFPCFDEPALKAKFKVSLVRPLNDGYIALSNMNEESSEELVGQNKAIVHFAESVPMSTYLACFIVSDFKHKELTVNANGVGQDFTLRGFATPAQLDKVTWSLEVAKTITEYYIQYFQEEYPLPKLDMAAIPDFVSGAMEHWGLVTYRETSLLYEEGTSSTTNRRRVAQVVAHELAHMWFGNLVTMAWWDELWLNEGFASYIEVKGVDAALPEWKMMDQFIFTPQGVMAMDATLASHPIVQTVANPDQITEIFDSITYNKGASVIRMLEDFVGADVFSRGVSNYLKKHKYSTAVTGDLLRELEQVQTGDLDIKYIMATWTEQMGYPVINVEHVSGNQYRLTQKRFLSNPENEKEVINDSKFNYRWYVPITYITDAATTQRIWFNNNDTQIVLPDVGAHKWIKLNKDQVGYYRVNYPKEMWQSLTNALVENLEDFSVSDRGHLLNDVFSLAEATQVDYATALELTRYLANENEYVPWSVASSKINQLKTNLYYTEHYSKFSSFGKSIISAPYSNTSWNVGADQLENHKRTTILTLACSMGIQQCIDQAGLEFTRWLQNPSVRPHPDMRELVYYYGMFSVGNEERWFQMWNLYKTEPDAQEKAKLMYGLSAIQVPWILSQFVEFAEDEANVRSQDYFTALQYIAANRVGESIVWNYVRENWLNLVNRFGLNERYLGSMIPSITGRFDTELRLQEIRDFFAKYPEAGAGAAARQRALNNVQNNIKWLENNQKNIGDWLNANF